MFSAVFYLWCSTLSNQMILYKYALVHVLRLVFESEQYFCIGKHFGKGGGGGEQWLGMGLLYPGPGY